MPTKELRLLALDGGGVRGLSALMILEQLMEAVNPDSPPKPCDSLGRKLNASPIRTLH